MKLSIRMKIFLPVMLILILFPLSVWFVFSSTLDGHMNFNAERDLANMVRKAEEILAEKDWSQEEEENENALLAALRDLVQTEAGETRLLILSGRYQVLYPQNYDDQPEMSLIYSEFLTQLTGTDSSWVPQKVEEETIGENKYMLYYQNLDETESGRVRHLLFYCPVHDISGILDEVSKLVLMILAAMAAVSIVLSWFVAGSISEPVKRLCEAARGIGEKKFKKVETGATVKELCELENEINQMQDKLLQADQAERTFFQNASHELRTPLMSISGYAQGIQRGVFEDVSQAAGVILDESSRLTVVVDGILTLTRMDQLRYQVVPVELELGEFIEDQLERLEGLAYAGKIKLVFFSEAEHKIITDTMLLGRALSNVISNCIRYAKSEVRVTLKKETDPAEIRVEDDGPGIRAEELEHIFDRFYKGKDGNHGLGLSIAKRSMEYIGGDITAVSSARGAVFIITMPQDCRSFAVEDGKGM